MVPFPIKTLYIYTINTPMKSDANSTWRVGKPEYPGDSISNVTL
jgi:hypothetical protein